MNNILRRSCANCCAFLPEEGECANGLGEVAPGDCCGCHMTDDEFANDEFEHKCSAQPAEFERLVSAPAYGTGGAQ